jgi:hypothetical protein
MREYGLSRGKSGRPKRRLTYGRRGRAWGIAGGIAAAGLAGALLLRKRGTST